METESTSTPPAIPVATPNPADDVGAPPAAPRGPNSGLNTAQAAKLKKADDIVTVALSAPYQAALCDTSASLLPADHPSQLNPDRLERLRAAIEQCRKDSAKASGETASSHDATPAIDLAERRLVGAIQRVQKRARQKYLRKNPELLAKFHVGHRLADNRANLEQFASNVLIQVESDPLPGLTKDALTELTAARDDWKKEMARQAAAGEALRQSILEQLDHILDERSAIQFAADDLWPHDDPKNVEIRKKFYLPLDRPLTN